FETQRNDSGQNHIAADSFADQSHLHEMHPDDPGQNTFDATRKIGGLPAGRSIGAEQVATRR
ncbi:MAG: hypothetical protein KDA72_13960, partial [Planctomycetales bacterium]|nr:hypothetical protein [Planctomycetales bacterium]